VGGSETMTESSDKTQITKAQSMAESPDKTQITKAKSIKCLKCGQFAHPDAKTCPACGNPFPPRTIDTDGLAEIAALSPVLVQKPAEEKSPDRLEFTLDASVILQFLPTGACVSLALEHPVVMGRGLGPEVDKMLDLTDFQGLLYGVSRQHCKLERRGTRLMVSDLGSTNGTYLNSKRLPPFQDQMIGHGDRLILGALHIMVMFSKAN
jgi:ribosomal protein L37E